MPSVGLLFREFSFVLRIKIYLFLLLCVGVTVCCGDVENLKALPCTVSGTMQSTYVQAQ